MKKALTIGILCCLLTLSANKKALAKPCGRGYIADHLTCHKDGDAGEIDGKTVGILLGGVALVSLILWAVGTGIRERQERQQKNEQRFRELQEWEDNFLQERGGSLVWYF